MATQIYHDWVRAGRPWQLARPIQQLENWANRVGVPVLGTIGNEAHLQASFPEDHTPFSRTAWPVPLPGWWVTAIDLADVDGLGRDILARARQGLLPWLKYMNVAGRNYAFADGFREGSPNPDQHIHISIFSDELNTDIDGFDPWGDDMPTAQEIAEATVDELLRRRIPKANGQERPIATFVRHTYDQAGKAETNTRRLLAGQEAMVDQLEGLAPGIAQAAAEAVASVSAADVADELEVTVRSDG